MHVDLGIFPGESGLVVADIMHGQARQMRQVFMRNGVRPAGLSSQNNLIGGHQRLTGDAGIGVGGQKGVHDGVGNPVGDLVGMAFGDGLRCKQKFTLVAHAEVLQCCGAG